MTIELADRLEIHEVAARYGNVVDDRDWDVLSSVFTEDASFVLTGFEQFERRCAGLAEIRQLDGAGPPPHRPPRHERDGRPRR